jgi:hypothetical protein
LQREKNNLQDLNGVYVFHVPERDYLDRPTARLIKEFDNIQGMNAYALLGSSIYLCILDNLIIIIIPTPMLLTSHLFL